MIILTLFYQNYRMNNIFFIAIILFSQVLLGQNIEGFSFNDFPAKEITSKKVPVNLSSHPLGLKYKTAITEQYNKGQINFGGHYIVVLWGAGAGLSLGVMVDVLNGIIYKLPLNYENSYRGTYHDQNNNILYEKHSHLFICYKSKSNEINYDKVDLDYSFYRWDEAKKLFSLINTKKITTDVIDD